MIGRTFAVTGSQTQTVDIQCNKAYYFLADLRDKYVWLRAGDCVGRDYQVSWMWKNFGGYVHGHPPLNSAKRTFFPFDTQEDPLPYLERNKKMVDNSELLLALPIGVETLRSGTWSTVRYARKLGKPIVIIWPTGSITKENH
jgi:hypothetical protein